MNTLIVGLQYGDEGKGRVSEFYGRDIDWFVRYNGGPNAGHTVYHEGKKFSLHHLPAGAVLGKNIALDAGMVINYFKLDNELKKLDLTLDDIYIHKNAHMIYTKHEEQDSNGSGIGSTKSGIAYAYSDKMLRKGVRAEDFFIGMLSTNLYDGKPPIKDDESAIYESAQGIMLDVDYGYYPYVTSSSVFPSVVHNIDKKVGVMKAYTSRVGDGPPNYPEVKGLAELGSEFGTTTGRRRRCTWLITKEIEYAISLLNPDEIVLTKMDVLDNLNEIGVWNDAGRLITFKNRREYEEFLIKNFPQIKWISESPEGEMRHIG